MVATQVVRSSALNIGSALRRAAASWSGAAPPILAMSAPVGPPTSRPTAGKYCRVVAVRCTGKL